jgi:ribosomal protein S18 acetylase RimI-like enzyme
MSMSVKKLEDALNFTEFFLDAIQNTWIERGYDVKVKDILREKIELVKEPNSKVSGIVLFDKVLPVAIAWVENNTGHYGNIVLFSMNAGYRQSLVDACLDEGLFNGVLLEIVVIEDTTDYHDYLNTKNLVKNSRKRMCYWLDEGNKIEIKDHPYTFKALTENDLDISGQISYDAHMVSKDYEMYPDLSDPLKRITLEKKVYNDLYGPVIKSASLMLLENDEVIATCFMIEVKCWGYDKVPWVFDLVVKPEHHGKGAGRILMCESLNRCLEEKYPICGLAVTMSNKYALRLYEKLNFQPVDDFYEYIRIAK